VPPIPEPEEPKRRLTTPYTRQTMEWVAVAAFAGIASGIVAIVLAVAYRVWTA
jgi:hypothetical protein